MSRIKITKADLEAIAKRTGRDLGIDLQVDVSRFCVELYAKVNDDFRKVTTFNNKVEARRSLIAMSTFQLLKLQNGSYVEPDSQSIEQEVINH